MPIIGTLPKEPMVRSSPGLTPNNNWDNNRDDEENKRYSSLVYVCVCSPSAGGKERKLSSSLCLFCWSGDLKGQWIREELEKEGELQMEGRGEWVTVEYVNDCMGMLKTARCAWVGLSYFNKNLNRVYVDLNLHTFYIQVMHFLVLDS